MSKKLAVLPTQKEAKDPSIAVSLDYHGAYQRLANAEGKSKSDQEANFGRMVDLFMLAAVQGFKVTGRKPLKDTKKQEIFRWHNFNEHDVIIINAIALLQEKDKADPNPEIINSKAKLVELMEEYANGGFQDILKKIDSSPDFEGNYVQLLATDFQKPKP